MKKKISPFIFTCLILLLSVTSKAQNARYHDAVFDSITKTTVTFSDTFNLQMDVYQPFGDSLCHRPVIVFAHEGSFTSQDRTDDYTVVALCKNFAHRGYVTASIDYRLGVAFAIGSPSMATDSTYAINEVMQAIGDGKAAVRYFRKDAYTANQFRIDTNLIYGGGNSAGAVLFMHYLFITDINQAPPALHQIILNNGGLEGNSGNAGYSSEINAVLSLAGGVNNPDFVVQGSKPIAHFQGDQDNVVPYTCANAENGLVQVRLCGLGTLDPLYNSDGVTHVSVVFPGDGHVPWDNDNSKLVKVDSICRNFLDSIVPWPAQVYCDAVSGIHNMTEDDFVSVYPNPASQQITISFPEISAYDKVQLVDETGRVLAEKIITNPRTNFERSDFSAGVYFVRVQKKDGSTLVRKVVFL